MRWGEDAGAIGEVDGLLRQGMVLSRGELLYYREHQLKAFYLERRATGLG